MKFTRPDGTEVNIPRIPQEEIDQFYAAAGFIINQWSIIDRQFFECFHAVLGITEQQAAILYYAWSNIGSRITILNDILLATLENEILEKWKNLKSSLDLSTRNLLAHHPIQIETKVSYNLDLSVTATHFIRAKFEEKELLAGKKKDKTITYAELLAAFKKAEETQIRVKDFKDMLAVWISQSQPTPAPSPPWNVPR